MITQWGRYCYTGEQLAQVQTRSMLQRAQVISRKNSVLTTDHGVGQTGTDPAVGILCKRPQHYRKYTQDERDEECTADEYVREEDGENGKTLPSK